MACYSEKFTFTLTFTFTFTPFRQLSIIKCLAFGFFKKIGFLVKGRRLLLTLVGWLVVE